MFSATIRKSLGAGFVFCLLLTGCGEGQPEEEILSGGGKADQLEEPTCKAAGGFCIASRDPGIFPECPADTYKLDSELFSDCNGEYRACCKAIIWPGQPGSECWGGWLDQNLTCRTPADGVYPDKCCEAELTKKCWGSWLDENLLCRTIADGVLPDKCCEAELSTRCAGASRARGGVGCAGPDDRPLPEVCCDSLSTPNQ
jgi:hypothetical protein